jgi:hypothetical protein
MGRILFGVFLVLHGLVHLLYLGQSARLFELQPGMLWPDGAWLFSHLLGKEVVRQVANFALGAAAVVLVVGGVGALANQSWWQPLVIGSSLFSILIFLAFWNGEPQRLDNQGAIGILINIAVILAALNGKRLF